MELSKAEFKNLMMLCAANIDGNIQSEEMEEILEKSDETTFKKMSKVFKSMSDSDIIDTIRENRKLFAVTETEISMLLDDFCSIIEAIKKRTPKEIKLLKAAEKNLKEC